MDTLNFWLSIVSGWLDSHSGGITAVATVFIAWFTIALSISTKRLWKEAKRASAIAYRAARTAKRSADIDETALVAGERAFVFPGPISFQYRPVSAVENRYWFQPTWINSGDTPTKKMRTHIRFHLRDDVLPADFDFRYETNEVAPALIAPKSSILGPVVPSGGVTREDLLAVHQGTKFAYIWGWIKYFDVFPNTPEHITRYCYQIQVNGDPLSPGPDLKGVDFMYPIHLRNNCADEECDQEGA